MDKRIKKISIVVIVFLMVSPCITLHAAIKWNKIVMDNQLEQFIDRVKDSIRRIRDQRIQVEQTKKDMRVKLDDSRRRAQEQRIKAQDTMRRIKAFQADQRRKMQDYRRR